MSNPYFEFKEFTVYHDRCAMKVGTDGVLLGAWARVEGAASILDIGCGTGLIALMAAQRNATARVTGIEIVPEAAQQALDNVARSRWSDRMEVVQTALQEYRPEGTFEAIVSNPPYFVNALRSPVQARTNARHTDTLTFEDLTHHAARLLSEQGEFSVVIPLDAMGYLCDCAQASGLYLSRCTRVSTTAGAAPKRVLLAFKKQVTVTVEHDLLVIESAPRVYSEAYKALTGAFYLTM